MVVDRRAMLTQLVLILLGGGIQQCGAQFTSTLTGVEGDTITLLCSLNGTYTHPVWNGPPSLKYTNQDDVTEQINPSAPAASRLSYAANDQDLLLANAVISDSGEYKCSYTGLGFNTITLIVTTPPTTTPIPDDDEAKKIGGGVGGGIGGLLIIGGIAGGVVYMKKRKLILNPNMKEKKKCPWQEKEKICTMIKHRLTFIPLETQGPVVLTVQLFFNNINSLGFDHTESFVVTDVTPGGPADKKLKIGDKIISINGRSIKGKNPGEVQKMLQEQEKKGSVTLKVERGTQSGVSGDQGAAAGKHGKAGVNIEDKSTVTYSAKKKRKKHRRKVAQGGKLPSLAAVEGHQIGPEKLPDINKGGKN